ncbi:MAG: hypothetical protein M1833_001976 [Piccolia ochrophora]|nr:MAG: hypothetical protein M1833_001976 [Piccolia ochrophora]
MKTFYQVLLFVSMQSCIVACFPGTLVARDDAALREVTLRNHGQVPARYKLLESRELYERDDGHSRGIVANMTKAIEAARFAGDALPIENWDSLPGDSHFIKLRMLDSHMDDDEPEVFAPTQVYNELVEQPVQTLEARDVMGTLHKRADICDLTKQGGEKSCEGSKLSRWRGEAVQWTLAVGAVGGVLVAAPRATEQFFLGLSAAITAGRELRMIWNINDAAANILAGPFNNPNIHRRSNVLEKRQDAPINNGQVNVAYQRASKSNIADGVPDSEWGCMFSRTLNEMRDWNQQQIFIGMQHGGTWWAAFDHCIHVPGGPPCRAKCGFGPY